MEPCKFCTVRLPDKVVVLGELHAEKWVADAQGAGGATGLRGDLPDRLFAAVEEEAEVG